MFRQFIGDNLFDTHKEDEAGATVGFPERTYDPRKRGWYIAAKAAGRLEGSNNALGNVIVTEPYVGAGKPVWMVTIAQAVYDLNDERVLRGVVGIDLEITDIQDAILRVHFLKKGYVVLTESTARAGAGANQRIVIAHPKFAGEEGHEKVPLALDAALPDIGEVEPDLVANVTLFATALGPTSGVENYGDDGDGGA